MPTKVLALVATLGLIIIGCFSAAKLARGLN